MLVAVPRARGSSRFRGSTEDHPIGSSDGWAWGTVAVLRGVCGAPGERVPWKKILLEGLDEDGTNVDITDWQRRLLIVCVCVCVRESIGLCNHHHIQDTEQFYHPHQTKFFMLLLLVRPSSHLYPMQPLIGSPSLSFPECHISGVRQCVPL